MAEPSTLTAEAACIDRCIPQGMAQAVQILLLQELAGNTMTPSELTEAAACYDRCIPKGQQPAVIIYLLDQLAGGGAGGAQYAFEGNYGGGVPTDIPTVSAAVAFDTSTGTEWHWYSGQWN